MRVTVGMTVPAATMTTAVPVITSGTRTGTGTGTGTGTVATPAIITGLRAEPLPAARAEPLPAARPELVPAARAEPVLTTRVVIVPAAPVGVVPAAEARPRPLPGWAPRTASVRGAVLVRTVGPRAELPPSCGPGAGLPPSSGPGAGPRHSSGTRAVLVPAAGAAGRLGRRKRGLMRRGHRPIIATTTGALCSPRPN